MLPRWALSRIRNWFFVGSLLCENMRLPLEYLRVLRDKFLMTFMSTLQVNNCVGTVRKLFQFSKKCIWSASRKRAWRCDYLFQQWSSYSLEWCVNKHNMRYWATTNLLQLHQRPLHSPKSHCLVCIFLSWDCWFIVFWRIWGHSYSQFKPLYNVNMLEDYFFAIIWWNGHLEDIWYQQDRAVAHISLGA